MYYPSSENKLGVDQLRSYCEADLRLCQVYFFTNSEFIHIRYSILCGT